MIAKAKRWVGSQLWKRSGQATRNRRALYDGAPGLRILTFHETGDRELQRIEALVSTATMPFADPADADAVASGSWPHDGDRLLLTFDDGFESNFKAAQWLADAGISAIFFIVPSLIDRSLDEFAAYHAVKGVRAQRPLASPHARGLALTQVREMVAMGHRIGAHNFAHRDLGRLHTPWDLAYDIDRALDAVSEMTGVRCQDFAIAYGQPENVSDAAIARLQRLCARVYACHRGLNVPGVTPRILLRDAVEPYHPLSFTRICIEGGGDHHLADRIRLMSSRAGLLPRVGVEPVMARWNDSSSSAAASHE